MKNKICSKCGNYDNRGMSIDALILHGNRLLLVERKFDPYKGFWALPGGMVDYDETIEETVIREVKEETNLDVVELKFFGIFSNPKRHPRQNVAVAYIVKTQGTPKAGDDAKNCRYFEIVKIPQILAFDHKEVIDKFLKLVHGDNIKSAVK